MDKLLDKLLLRINLILLMLILASYLFQHLGILGSEKTLVIEDKRVQVKKGCALISSIRSQNNANLFAHDVANFAKNYPGATIDFDFEGWNESLYNYSALICW